MLDLSRGGKPQPWLSSPRASPQGQGTCREPPIFRNTPGLCRDLPCCCTNEDTCDGHCRAGGVCRGWESLPESAGASRSVRGKEGGQPGAGRWLEHGLKRVNRRLDALFSFSLIFKQQISQGLRYAISIPARQCDLALDFPAAHGAARGILRVCPTQVEASLPAEGEAGAGDLCSPGQRLRPGAGDDALPWVAWK